MSQELDIEVQISSVEQITSGITTITPESIGAVPIGQSGKISSSYLPDQASLDTEVDTKITTHSDDTTNVHGISDTSKLIHDGQVGFNTDKVVKFNYSSGSNDNSEIAGWGFGVSNGNGEDAYIEPTGLIIEGSGKSVLVAKDKVELDNGAKLRKGTTDAQNGGYKGIALECSAQYELKWEAGRLYTLQQDGFTIRSVEHCMSVPSALDDETKGYVVGSRWVMDSGEVRVCTDATEENAQWETKFAQDGLSGSIDTSGLIAEDETAGVVFTSQFDAGNLPILASFNGKNLYSNEDGIEILYRLAGQTQGGGVATNSGWILNVNMNYVSANAGNEAYPWLAVWPNGSSVSKQQPRTGGSINTKGGGSITTYGETAIGGFIDTHGEEVNGGYINTSASGSASGGNINTSAGGGSIYTHNFGGSINTSNYGGRIQTSEKGFIEFGYQGQRTDLQGTATSNRTIKLPDLSGTLALQSDAILRAVDFDLGRTSNPVTATLTQLTGYEMRPYTDYIVADISVQIKSRYKTQPLTSNFYTIPALQAYPIENYVFNSFTSFGLTAIGSPYTHPLVGTYIKIDSEYVLIDQVYDLVNGVRNIRVRRGQMGTSPNATHNAGGVFGIYESSVLFSTPPAVSVYNNWFGNAVSSDCPIGTRPLIGNISRSVNSTTSSSTGRQCLTYSDNGWINIQLTTLGTYLQTTSTSVITSTATTIPVTANPAFTGTNFYARITSTNGTEIVYVISGGGGANWSVLRGLLGTTAIAHTTGATLSTNVGSNGGSSLLGDIYVRLVPILR